MIQIPVEPPITEYLHAKASKLKMPISGTFELTPVCNMSCKMCYVRMSRKEQEAIRPLIPAQDWIKLGQTAKEHGLLFLLLTGGEPFSRPDFKEIMQSLHKLGLVISINSNGTLIDEKTVEWLRETPPARINMTLYGASDETYARLCGNPHGFTQATKAIRLLKEAGITVKLNCSVTPYNACDLEAIMDFAKREELIIQATSYMFPPLRRDAGKVGQNDRFSPEEAAYYSAKIEQLLNGDEAFAERVKQNDFSSLPSDMEDDCDETDGDGEGIRCRAGKCSYWVTWDGRMLPCGMMTEGGINVFEHGFDEAWRTASEYACDIRLPAKCKSCTLKDTCRVCASMVFTESGDFKTVPEYRCRMAHAYPAACKQIEREIMEKNNEK